MTRKHFQALADAIHGGVWVDASGHVSTEVIELIERIANACKSQNSGFKYDTFYNACGIDMSTGKLTERARPRIRTRH